MATGSQPDLAQSARTAIAQAQAATLFARQVATGERCVAVVAVETALDGTLLIAMDCQSPLTRTLAVRPVVTVAVPARPPYAALQVTGSTVPIASAHDGLVAYRLTPRAVRFVGHRCNAVVQVTDYLDASPDSFAREAPSIVDHLEEAHSADLLACVRAHGHGSALAVVPRHLDGYGLEVSVITAAGVESTQLAFPHPPVSSLDDVAAGIRAIFSCGCTPPDALGS